MIGFSQLKTVSGNVTDENGLPLPGASVIIEGSSIGVATDFDGNFSIQVNVGESIVVSYIGYANSVIEIGNLDSYSISLQVDSSLDEVIVTAFGIERKSRSVAYATSRIISNEITEIANLNPLESISGKIPGVDISSPAQPGASTKVIFRGISSITGSNRPLYVVNGSPVLNSTRGSAIGTSSSYDAGTGVNDIDPNNIDTIDFLKGASATALYGSRAANGVILITTKKAKNNESKIFITSSFDFHEVARVPHIQNQFGTGWNGASYSNVSGEGSSAASNENGSWGAAFNGLIKPWSRIVNNQQLIKPYVFLDNNVREFFDIGSTFSNSISISKDISKDDLSADYTLTLSRVSADGVIPTDQDSFKRNTVGINTGISFDKLKIRTSINYSQKNQKAVPTGQGDDASFGKSLMQELIQLPNDLSLLDMQDGELIFNTPSYFYTPYTTNPYQTLKSNQVDITKNRWFANLNLNYEFNDEFLATIQVSADNDNQYIKRWGKIIEYETGSPQDNASTNEVVGGVFEGSYDTQQYDAYLNLNYKKEINDDFNLDVLVGFNTFEVDFKGLFVSVNDLDLENFYELSNSASTPGISQTDVSYRSYGIYGQAIIDYQNNYFLTLTGRRDSSSALPLDKNSYFYPSVSLAGILKDTDKTFLKLRTSWARIGNGTGPYQIFSTAGQSSNNAFFGSITYPFGGVNGYEINGRIENQDLNPEITNEIEFGLDARLFNRRLAFDLSLYRRKTSDLIINLPVARSTGYSTVTGNFGDISNRGIELAINTLPIKTSDFSWELDVTFTKNKNRVDNIYGDDKKVSIYNVYSINFYAEEGKPLGSFYGPTPSKTNEGQYIVDPNTGYYDYDDSEDFLGTSQRDFIMGFQNQVRYKDFKLSFNFDWKKGGKFYSYTKRLSHFVGNGRETVFNDRNPWIIPNSVVEAPGFDADNPVYVENTKAVDYDKVTAFYNTSQNKAIEGTHVIDRSFFRLRSLSLSYYLNSDITDKVGISSAKISLYGKNLLLWTPAENPYVDPETTSYGSGVRSEYGEFATNPSQHSYGLSIQVSL